MGYKHGTYGVIGQSIVTGATQGDTVVVYFGTAPVNLIREYADLGIINNPVRVRNMQDVQAKVGYSSNWEDFTLCEAFAQHFDNTVGNIGPIYIVNVLDPDTHRASEQITRELTFTNKRAEFESSSIILDTFAIAGKAEGVDYELSYNYTKGTVVVVALTALTVISATYYEVDTSLVTSADIIGQTTPAGEFTGMQALTLLYQKENAVADILAAPGWSHIPAVYIALIAVSQKINGHWDAFVNADIPIMDGTTAVDTIDKAKAWQAEKGYTSEFSKVYWPKIRDGGGRVFHLSTVGTVTMMRVDLSRNSIPFESPSNEQIMATSQFFGENSKNRGFDQQTANLLNEKGITTAVFWAGQWVLWGPHTAAFQFGGSMDARAIFDVNIRMLMFITNSFQLDHGTRIDSPMNPSLRDTILNIEQTKLDSLVSVGALIGNPIVEFLELENPVSDMMNGDFVWDIAVTNTPPLKSATARVVYTDEGFAAFFGGE